MELKEEDIAKIENCGLVGFSYKEVAAVLGVNPEDIKAEFADEKGPIFSAWYKGRLQTELDLRNSMLRAAKDGAAPMVEKVLHFLKKTDDEHRDLID